MADTHDAYKMKDLISLSGVSRQTIHYYLREGLLPPPVRASKNMAYYDVSTVDDIRLIKELQEKRYLPLAVIKEILQAKRKGQDLADEDHVALFTQLFGHTQIEPGTRQLDGKSFLEKSGLTEKEMSIFIKSGLLSPSPGTENQFGEHELAVAGALVELKTMGLDAEDIEIYAGFLRFCRMEIELLHERIINGNPAERHKPLMDVYSITEKVKNLLKTKAQREFLLNHNKHHKGEI